MPRLLLHQAGRPAIAKLAALMLLSGLTEGFGILLLIPMLDLLGSGGGTSGIGHWLAAIGVPRRLDVLLGIFACLVVLRGIVNLSRDLASLSLRVRIVDGLRNRVYAALLHCDWRTASRMRQSDNASLLISNVDRVGSGVYYVLFLLASLATLGGVGAAALAISPRIAFAALAGGALALLAYRGLNRRAVRLGEQLGDAYRTVHARVSESLGALRVIKSFGREAQAQELVAGGFRALRKAERTLLRDAGVAKLALEAMGAVLLAGLVWLAVARWGKGPADILPLVALFARSVPLLSVVQGNWQNWAHCRPALDEVSALLAEVEAAREPGEAGERPPGLERAIVLHGATVKFEGRSSPALDNVSLDIPARGLTALVGPSGAGKSTLADLAGGLLAPDTGEVRIDGVVLGDRLKRAWRQSVVYVQQEPVLFTGTIRDNFTWAQPEVSDRQIGDALLRASAAFVDALPAGLDTLVGDGGRQLSGGERQRIVLARALLSRPALLILDEATSALDPENEAAIASALDGLRAEMAILVICHRGELRNLADRVVTLEGGRIVAVEHPAKHCN